MSNYIVRDVYYLWKWLGTFIPQLAKWKNGGRFTFRAFYWHEVTRDGWFLGIPLWFGKRRGKG